MERLVVFLAILAISSACKTTVGKDFVFGCPAPNNKGMQAILEEFSVLPKDDTIAFLNSSSSIYRIGKLLFENSNEIVSSPEYEKLQQFLCEKAFVDSATYHQFFWVCVWYACNSAPPEIPDSELRADFMSYTSKLYQSEMYQKTQKVLYQHIRSDPYAQLGMEYLDSAERRQLLKQALSIPVLKPEVDKLTSLGLPVSEAIEVLAYAAATIWSRTED